MSINLTIESGVHHILSRRVDTKNNYLIKTRSARNTASLDGNVTGSKEIEKSP
jgi:hypothetical protein